jgi:hypothetical protein
VFFCGFCHVLDQVCLSSVFEVHDGPVSDASHVFCAEIRLAQALVVEPQFPEEIFIALLVVKA